MRGKIILPRFFVIGITCLEDIENASERKAATQQELENVRYQVENAEVDYAVA